MKDEARGARLRFGVTGANSDAIIYVLDPSCHKLGRMSVKALYVASSGDSWKTVAYVWKKSPSRERKDVI